MFPFYLPLFLLIHLNCSYQIPENVIYHILPLSCLLSVSVSLSMPLSVSPSLSLCVAFPVYFCLCLSVSLPICLCRSVSVSVCVCHSVSPCVCLWVYLSVSVSISICVCVYLSLSFSLPLSLWECSCWPIRLFLVVGLYDGKFDRVVYHFWVHFDVSILMIQLRPTTCNMRAFCPFDKGRPLNTGHGICVT